MTAGFVLLFHLATSPLLPSADHPLIFYSNQSRQDIKALFFTAFNTAASSIYVNMYGITDPDMIAVLRKKAHFGIKTLVEYDKGASANLFKKLPAPVITHPVRCRGLMHRKIIIIDHKIVFLGSANLTMTSLKHHDNLVVGIASSELANFITDHASFHEKPPRTKKSPPVPPFSFTVADEQIELRFLPDQEDKTLNYLLSYLTHAKKSIQIAMFTLTHPTIADALIEAFKRGVLVQVAIDYYTSRGASKKLIEKLQANKIPILLSRSQHLLHHKWALIDAKSLIMGSANWTKAAFSKNEDFLLFFPRLGKDRKKMMKNLWNAIEQESF